MTTQQQPAQKQRLPVIDAQSDRTMLSEIGARSIPEFDGVHNIWPRGDRPTYCHGGISYGHIESGLKGKK